MDQKETLNFLFKLGNFYIRTWFYIVTEHRFFAFKTKN